MKLPELQWGKINVIGSDWGPSPRTLVPKILMDIPLEEMQDEVRSIISEYVQEFPWQVEAGKFIEPHPLPDLESE